MKRCPYCAEEIQDAAIKCRYCHSDLTVAPQPDAPPPAQPQPVAPPASQPGPAWAPQLQSAPQVGEGAMRFSHSGHRYILGYGADFFGIWDRTAPGGPVSRYPRTDEGWNQAWNQFTGWEPRAIAVPQTSPPPDARWTPSRFRSGHGLAVAVSVCLCAVALLHAITFAFRLQELGLLRRIQNGQTVSFPGVHASDKRLAAMLTLVLLAEVPTVVLWLMWQFRAHSNLPALGAQSLRYSPGWAVGWWFIPFANFAMPYLTMRELMLASSPEAGALDWKSRRAPALLVGWWAAWLAPIVAAGIGSPASFVSNPTASQVINQETWGLVGGAITILAAILAVLVVRSVETRQASKWARVSSGMVATGAGLGATQAV